MTHPPRATRVERALLRKVADSVVDGRQRDEMAGPSYLHPVPLVRWLFWKRLDVVAQFLDVGNARYESGLDFGCGLGVLLATLSAATRQVYATDLVLEPARRLAAALHVANVTFVVPSDLSGDIQPGSLDYVVSTDVLEHVDDLGSVIETLRTALRTGGQLVISGPTENIIYKAGRVLVGFGGKGDYHHTDIHRIHEHISRPGSGFRMVARRVLPLPHLVEAFHVYSYSRLN